MTAPVVSLEAQISDLLSNLGSDTRVLNENNAYFEACYRPKAIGMAVPLPMKKLMAKIGWGRTYVGAIEERLDVEGFRMVKKSGTKKVDERLWQWWQSNNMDVESGLAHTEALIHGRAYITISAPELDDPLSDNKTPVIKVESPKDIFAEVHPVTRRVTRAIRRYQAKNPLGVNIDHVTLYLPNSTIGLYSGPGGWVEEWRVDHDLGIVPVVPILNKERVLDYKGCTEIKPELRSTIDAASRLLMNMQATAELMAIPQRVLFGLDENEISKIEGKASWESYLANILAFEDANGKIAQFAAAELRNFSEGMKLLREEASTITGLGPQYFHFGMDNPASAEAMQASEVRLVKKAERKCRIFGEAWETVMRICILIMDGSLPEEAFRMETIWRNPATPTFAAKADAVVKLVSASTPDGRSVVPVERGRVDLGYSPEEREEMDLWDKNTPKARLADMVGQSAVPRRAQQPAGTPAEPGVAKE